MSAQLATLGIAVESAPANKAAADLNNLAASAKKAETATGGISTASQKLAADLRRTAEQMRQFEGAANSQHLQAFGAELDRLRMKFNPLYSAIQQYKAAQAEIRQAHRMGAISSNEMTAAIARERQAALSSISALKGRETALRGVAAAEGKVGLAANDNSSRFRRQNLTYQLFDVGQMAALGQNPAMTLMQQGPQIAQLYAGQGGVNAALKDMAALATMAARALGPIAVVAGAGALAIRDLQGEIKEATGVAVTFGDVAKAVFQVIGVYIMDSLQPAIDWIAPYFTQAWDLVQEVTGIAFNGVVAAVLTAIETIKFASGALPTAFRVAGEGAANAFIAGINYMVEQSLTGINAIIEAINFVTQAGNSGLSKFDPKAYEIAPVDLGGVNDLSERFEKLQTTLGEINQADYLGDFKKDLSDQSVKNAADRLSEVEKKAKDAGRGLSEADKEARAFADALKEIERQGEAFEGQADGLLDKFFPGEAAKREAQELMTLLDQFGSRLDTFQRQAVEGEIAGLQTAAELGLRRLPDQARERGQESADALSETIGQELSDLFSQPYDSMSDFFDAIIDKLAKVGQHFADLGWERLVGQFTGMPVGGGRSSSYGGANDNVPTAQDVQRRLADSMEATSKSALDVARGFDGLNERADSKVLDGFLRASGNWKGMSAQDTAWCASFANAAIMQSGGQGTGSNMASSFLNWGNATNAPKPGDIVVLKPQSRGASGHVGFVAGFGDGTVQVFGGNQSGGANTKSFGMDQVAGFRTDPRLMTRAVSDGVVDANDRVTGMQGGATGAAGGGFMQNGGMSVLGAGAGAFAQGFQSGSPFGGGISGAMSGYGAAPAISSALGVSSAMAGILGIAGGGILGMLGGIFGKKRQQKQEQQQAKKELEKQMGAIEEMLDYASGTITGGIGKAVREFKDETAKAIELATKAGDKELASRLKASVGALEARLIKDFTDAYEGTIEGMNLGLGIDNPFKQGFDAVKALRDELLAFVDDAKTAGLAFDAAGDSVLSATGKAGSAANSNNLNEYQARDLINRHQRGEDISQYSTATWGLSPFSGDKDNGGPNSVYMEQLFAAREAARAQALAKAKDAADGAAEAERQLSDARKAAVNQALSVLSGATELTEIEQQMMELRGKVAALAPVLKNLGLGADEATRAIESHLAIAVAKLKDQYIDDVTRSINDLSGMGFMNDIIDAQETYKNRLKDAAAVGLDGSLAMEELNLSIAQIASSASLTDDQLKILAQSFPALASSLMGAMGGQTVADAQAAVERARSSLRAAYEKEASALEQTIERTKDFIKSIRDFKDSLKVDNALSPLSGYDRMMEAQKQFRDVSVKAMGGDVDAMAQLESASREYLDEARAYYASSEDYYRAFNEVQSILDKSLSSAEKQLTKEEQQLVALKDQVSKLIDIDNSVKTVAEAIAALAAAQSAMNTAMAGAAARASAGSNEDIARAYNDSLGRAPDAAGQAYWAGSGKTGDQIRSDIAGSPEAQINKAYRDILGRDMDAASEIYWKSSGKTPEQIRADLEWAKAHGSYASGGYTGNVGVNDIAGVVHGQEFVMNAAATARWRPQFEAINAGRAPGGAGDNSAVVAELRAVRAELAEIKAGQRQHITVTAQGAVAVKDAVETGNGTQQTMVAVAKRRSSA